MVAFVKRLQRAISSRYLLCGAEVGVVNFSIGRVSKRFLLHFEFVSMIVRHAMSILVFVDRDQDKEDCCKSTSSRYSSRILTYFILEQKFTECFTLEIAMASKSSLLLSRTEIQ